jgi:microcystin-dependent protein
MNPYLSTIYIVGFNFANRGFAECNGQILSISQNAALFSLIGTFYGGNGTSTFQLPDLRGRTVLGQGQGPGLTDYFIGESSGTETVTILSSQMPIHSHNISASNAVGTTGAPAGAVFAKGPTTGSGPSAVSEKFYNVTTPNVVLHPTTIGATGGNIPVAIVQPVLTLNCLIAMQGIFPSRN